MDPVSLLICCTVRNIVINDIFRVVCIIINGKCTSVDLVLLRKVEAIIILRFITDHIVNLKHKQT